MTTKDEKNIALLTHLSGFGGYIIPLGSVIIPLIIWQTKKEESKFIDHNGKEAINFNLSYLLYTFILSISTFPFFVGSFFRNLRGQVIDFNNLDLHFDFNSDHFFGLFGVLSLVSILAIGKVILIIMNAIASQKGEKVKYPLTIKFIK
jgi:uncharacterized Tic20 family protein